MRRSLESPQTFLKPDGRMRPIGPLVPMNVWPPRVSLAGGQSDRSGRWPSRVWMTSIPISRALSSALGRLNRAEQQGSVVAEGLAKATGQHEVALHVDDQQRGGGRVEVEVERFGVDFRHVIIPPVGRCEAESRNQCALAKLTATGGVKAAASTPRY